MKGLMQDWPLVMPKILDHAALYYPDREIVTRTVEGPMHRYTYRDLHARTRRLAKALDRRGVRLGDRVATLAWNTYRHVEAWYGIMGLGAITHTVNPRLFPEQIIYIVNHAGDRMLFFDTTFAELVAKVAPKLETVETYVAMCDRAHLPEAKIPNLVAYEDLMGEADGDFAWKKFPEDTACGLCYTSGTTGNPKGVLYSHRSNVIHALTVNSADMLGMSNRDAILPIVPMFHANAWAIVFAGPMVGVNMILPGAKLDGASVHELLEKENVTVSAAVPTVWLGLLQFLEQNDKKPGKLKRVVIGGSACPRAIMEKFEKNYGVEVIHAWGMTEMSPVGTLAALKAGMETLDAEAKIRLKLKQGRPPFTVEMKIVDDAGRELPRDGKAFGRLKVRGPAIAKGYFKGEGGDVLDDEGWFDTGDVATIDEHGFMQITDRAKDVIKSGGEWISSIEIENIAVGHPAVAEAAVIGVRHPKWDERPLLIVVLREGQKATREDILKFLDGKIAKWWMPDDVAFTKEIPHTATGKIQKIALREQFGDWRLPTAAE